MSLTEKIENNRFVKFLAAIEPIGIAVALIGFGFAHAAFFLDLQNRKEGRISRA